MGGIGSTATEGYVEVLASNGEWGGVCGNKFDIFDAHVVCKMLGFPTAIEALTNGTADDLYGTSPSGDKLVLNDLGCTGNEVNVFDCSHPGEWKNDCKATDIAGVHCATSKFFKGQKKYFSVEFLESGEKKEELVLGLIEINGQKNISYIKKYSDWIQNFDGLLVYLIKSR